MNALNAVQSGIEILQNFFKEVDIISMKLPVKIKDILKIEKNNFIDVSVVGYEK